MPVGTRMGARIRARRVDLGMRQTDLAAAVGISAPYLNLIEHERRRIGGRLLIALARALGVDPNVLAEGAEAGLIAALGEAGQGLGDAAERAADLAARFPAWAGLVARQHRRISELEATVETLSDRLTNDPRLAAALHEVLSTVTAIRSTAAILNEETDLGREWLDRFHRNLDQDGRRLAASARDLVGYLEGEIGGAAQSGGAISPQERFEAWMAEGGTGPLPETEEARALAEAWRDLAEADRQAVPDALLGAALSGDAVDPAAIAAEARVPLATVFRRLAALPGDDWGLLTADAAGAITFRKLPQGFQLPRLGAACALLPLFRVLSRPLQPATGVLEQAARLPRRFRYWALAEPVAGTGLSVPTAFHALMLLRREEGGGTAEPVGTTCRVCPRPECPARREASVLPG